MVGSMRPMRWIVLALVGGVAAAALWFSFAVELGDKTLVEHLRAIGATREARALAAGTSQETRALAASAKDGASRVAHGTGETVTRAGESLRRAIGRGPHLPESPEGAPAVKRVDGATSGEARAPVSPPLEDVNDRERAELGKITRKAAAK